MYTWLLALALAHPVQLPDGEDPEAWASVLALVDLEAVPEAPSIGVRVSIIAEGPRWVVQATGPDGDVRTARVAVARSAAEREAVAQLASSLVRAVDAPALPPLPPLPVRPTRVRTTSTVPPRAVEPPPPEALPVPVEPTVPVEPPVLEAIEAIEAIESEAIEPENVGPEGSSSAGPEAESVPVAPAEVAERPATEPPRPVQPFAWGAVGLQARATVLPAIAAGAWAGAEARLLRAGVGIEGTAPAYLTGLGVEARVQRTSAWGGAWACLGPVELGGVAGGQLHRYLDDGGTDAVAVPTVGASVALFPARSLRIEGRVHRDLRRVEVFVGADRLRVAEPWSGQLSVAWVPLRRASRTRSR